MKRLFYRIMAFVLDTMLVALIAYGLSFITFINPNIKDVSQLYKEYGDVVEQYLDLTELGNKFDDYTKDKILDDGETKEISEKYSYFISFTKVKNYENYNEISKSLKKEMKDDIEKNYEEYSNKYKFLIAKKSRISNVIGMVVALIYFGLLQFLFKGQTLFKKLFKLKVVSTKEGKKVNILSYLLRAFLVAEIIFKGADIVLLSVLKQNAYLNAYTWLTETTMIYELAFLITLLVRDDGMSLHDMLLGTKVVRYDKEGNIIDETIFNQFPEVKEETKEEDKETPKKKTTTKKNTKKNKEYVEAEKIDD